jgi:hypothetical protein
MQGTAEGTTGQWPKHRFGNIDAAAVVVIVALRSLLLSV